MTTPHPT
ncbi:hypothetical protein E2C01_087146 [Portunus trituberculatus]|nr:hypothetical protein [Portunus trituberculatus]